MVGDRMLAQQAPVTIQLLQRELAPGTATGDIGQSCK